jgi:hypothetical protein
MWKTGYTAALGALVALGVVVTAATRWSVYPIGLIVLLCAAIFGLVAVVVRLRRAPEDPMAHEHDAWVVREVRSRLSRTNVETLVSWDFGGSWRQDYVDPFMRLAYDVDDVEHRPRDAAFGRELRALLDATHGFLEYYSYNTFMERVYRPEQDWRNVGWSAGEAEDLRGEQRELWQRRVRTLGSLAAEIGTAYDTFIDTARRKGLLDVEN